MEDDFAVGSRVIVGSSDLALSDANFYRGLPVARGESVSGLRSTWAWILLSFLIPFEFLLMYILIFRKSLVYLERCKNCVQLIVSIDLTIFSFETYGREMQIYHDDSIEWIKSVTADFRAEVEVLETGTTPSHFATFLPCIVFGHVKPA